MLRRLTFQQVQKYERGTNRISASKLYEIVKALEAPVPYFFKGYGSADTLEDFDQTESEHFVHEFLVTSERFELAEAFPRVTSSRHRQKILDLVRTLAEE